MRYTLFLFALIATTVLFTANTTFNEDFFDNFIFLAEEKPDLPEIPFNYEDQQFPEHLMFTDWGDNDSTVFDNITNHGATLGRVLFYDEALSANDNLACATCHSQELSFADKTPFSMGVTSETDVNSMQLNDLGWSNNTGFFWDMSHSNLAEMIALPLTNPNEIGLSDIETLVDKLENTAYYPELFENAYGSVEITQEKIQDAISQFISSMTTFESRFDRAKRGEIELNNKEAQGEALFAENCSICHTDGNSFFIEPFFGPVTGPSASIFIAPFMFTNGLPLEHDDIGAGAWDPSFTGLFKTPTLRNIEKTGPYMHDGRFETLEEVVDHYSDDIGEAVMEWGSPLPAEGFNFSSDQKSALVAFMKTLTDETFLTDERFSDPFETGDTVDLKDPNIIGLAEVNVYPNPTTGPVNVAFDNFAQKNVEVYILGMDGKVIRKLSSHKSGLHTDISLLPAGAYIIRVMIGKEDWIDRKVVKS